jgi:hypothetical protein
MLFYFKIRSVLRGALFKSPFLYKTKWIVFSPYSSYVCEYKAIVSTY